MISPYPMPMSKPWFPHQVTIRVPQRRDAFGKVTEYTDKVFGAKCRHTHYTVDREGNRIHQRGLEIRMPVGSGVAVGSLIIFDGVEYTITQSYGSTDHRGVAHMVVLQAMFSRAQT